MQWSSKIVVFPAAIGTNQADASLLPMPKCRGTLLSNPFQSVSVSVNERCPWLIAGEWAS